MLREQVNIARVEFLRFVEIRLALIPVTSPPFDISQRQRNTTIIRQKLVCLLKVFHRSVVVLQARVVIKALCEHSFAKIGL